MPERIHQLPPNVANQIAAGEVIERPANAVKELVENAIDAGARRIVVELSEGGKKLIRVRDDGCGMTAGDAVLCLERHATSKIAEAEDLWRVQTLGFRGEALPSMAAVSRLEITTREHDAESGTHLIVEAGEVQSVQEVGCAPGTEITVAQLFYNTPARYKFLKSDSAEAARTSELMGHLALAYPHVSFSLKHNGNEMLRVDATGDAFNSLVAVLGRETGRQMLPISSPDETGQIRVTGFAGRPQLTRGNRKGQIFFVNGRVIKSRTLEHAFAAAYEGLLHGRDRFPVGVIFLTMPAGAVDVNVHPTKSEVRFAREGEAHHAVRIAVRDTLIAAQLAPTWGFATEVTGPFGHPLAPGEGDSQDAADGRPGIYVGPAPAPQFGAPQAGAYAGGNGYGSAGGYGQGNSQSYGRPMPRWDTAPLGEPGQFPEGGEGSLAQYPVTGEPTAEERERFREALVQIRNGNQPANFDPRLFHEPQQPRLQLRALAQITQNSYILCEGEDGLYIVNQHRAHERILADRALERAAAQPVESQILVIPYTMETGARELAAVEENNGLLKELGFTVESFGGNSLLVRSVPTLVAQLDYERAFKDLLDELVSGHAGRDLHERRRNLLVMLSCKNAIKAGAPLRIQEMQALVDDLVQLVNPSICPHGQPILIRISTWELHKKFEREYAGRPHSAS